jgi:NAD(P)-dependent dehydrogenase (short-subunit alcohol dehydrogenase family)
MDLQRAGKTALIAGGSKGIGRATAEVLAREGCNILGPGPMGARITVSTGRHSS